MQTRADELDVATRMLAARAQTMTSVIDAVTEQSIIGTDRDGVIRVWNPGAEKMLGLPRADVVRKRSIVEFHLPEELDVARPRTSASAPGLAALVHAAQEHGSDVRDWTYLAADGRHADRGGGGHPPHRRRRRARRLELRRHGHDRGAGDRAAEGPVREPDQPRAAHPAELDPRLPRARARRRGPARSPDEQRKYLTTVERNAHRLQRLVGDLLFTAQVEAGRFTLQPEDVDLGGRGPRGGGDDPGHRGRRRASTVGVERAPTAAWSSPGTPSAWGRPATTSSPTRSSSRPSGGRVTLALRAGWQTPDGEVTDRRAARAPCPWPSCRCSDTGIGIPAGEQGKLFTRFFRASTAQRNAVPGVGLGLTITKAITTAHGGTLDVVSAEGAGTTFTLTLPHRLSPRGSAAAARTAGPGPGVPAGTSSSGFTQLGDGTWPRCGPEDRTVFLRKPCGSLAGHLRLAPPESSLSPGTPDDRIGPRRRRT